MISPLGVLGAEGGLSREQHPPETGHSQPYQGRGEGQGGRMIG